MTPSSAKTIRPAKNLLGSLRLPGDKSISHRYAMLAAVAAGKTRLENFSTGADCASTVSCVAALGCPVTKNGATVEIQGLPEGLNTRAVTLDCGNSGSTIRMLSGLLAGRGVSCDLVGDDSLSRRPMARVIDPLRQMGANISAVQGHPPIHISPSASPLRAISYATPTPSAQVKTALLFAGLSAEGATEITEAVRTRDHGELALRAFGAEIHRSKTTVSMEGGQQLQAITAFVPGDISSAAFFFCAAAIFPGCSLIIESLGLNPTRASLLDVLTALGARISVINLEEHHGELVGTVKVEHSALRGLKLSGALSAQLIDELPVLAAIAPYTEEGVEIRDAKELRVKESDRIAAVAANLRKMGAEVEEFDDGLRVPGRQALHGAELDSLGDHRIAMAFAVAALRAEGDTLIHNADAANISFPEFWNMLDSVCDR
ncbi:MAG TPA: 3-phosphoshikimate 1-carboxyvinyltransferase [Terriglobales bacterium]|nr:3-phosphoshikimate 1-carboxyvinyltransferase [Terriglobales bacterium]